jgi:hypothetical protein
VTGERMTILTTVNALPQTWRSSRGDGFLREGDPVSVCPFIEAEKQGRRNVKRACELLKVSRAA